MLQVSRLWCCSNRSIKHSQPTRKCSSNMLAYLQAAYNRCLRMRYWSSKYKTQYREKEERRSWTAKNKMKRMMRMALMWQVLQRKMEARMKLMSDRVIYRIRIRKSWIRAKGNKTIIRRIMIPKMSNKMEIRTMKNGRIKIRDSNLNNLQTNHLKYFKHELIRWNH